MLKNKQEFLGQTQKKSVAKIKSETKQNKAWNVLLLVRDLGWEKKNGLNVCVMRNERWQRKKVHFSWQMLSGGVEHTVAFSPFRNFLTAFASVFLSIQQHTINVNHSTFLEKITYEKWRINPKEKKNFCKKEMKKICWHSCISIVWIKQMQIYGEEVDPALYKSNGRMEYLHSFFFTSILFWSY